MESVYDQIITFVTDAGALLKEKSGKIADIGVMKQFLTAEDLRIERGLKEIIATLGDSHSVYAEEENDDFQMTPNVWVMDPISSTKSFIEGQPHYAIVVAHVLNEEVHFAVVYDPSVDELFTARKGQGVLLNGQKLTVNENLTNKIILRVSSEWRDKDFVKEIEEKLNGTELVHVSGSVALPYCDIARGRMSGYVCLAKDSFPHFAGAFIVQEAGGCATNEKGSVNLDPVDRIFIAGTQTEYPKLFTAVSK